MAGVAFLSLIALFLEKQPRGAHWIGGLLSPRAHLDPTQKREKIFHLPKIEPRFVGRLAQTLYCLSYLGSVSTNEAEMNHMLTA
jgi:hypothetical protein